MLIQTTRPLRICVLLATVLTSSLVQAQSSQAGAPIVTHSVRDTEGDLLPSGEYQQYSATSKKEAERVYKALAQGVFVKNLDRPIKVIKAVPPDYPKFLMDAEIDGTVVIDFVVNEQGSVEGALVRVPAHSKLNSVCLKAVEKWRFEPMTSGGKPVKVRMRQIFPFQYNRRKGRH